MNTRQRIELSKDTGFGMTVVQNWDLGRKVTTSADRALTRAAERLGLLSERRKGQVEIQVESHTHATLVEMARASNLSINDMLVMVISHYAQTGGSGRDS